ncbi:MAG: isoaspartyl peptidase/L-asparaginase [Candidatus Promineifilaceae bacterium]
METVLIVHGGAGAWKLDSKRLAEGIAACQAAAGRGQEILQAGGAALDAVEAAVCILEDCPALDAGIGSYLNANGEIEMDALIMDGRSLDLGAVAAVQRIRHPISLARLVMTQTEHAVLVGAGAAAFADRIGFPRCTHEELLVSEELARFYELRQDPDYETVSIFVEPGAMGDTVGAVALDSSGNLACATSTGGTRQKLPGRVGDSPLVGAGGYADNQTAAVSATGYGEAIMKVLLSKQVCDFVAAGLSARQACLAALDVLEKRVNGRGGLVAVDYQGQIGVAFNTDAMPYAYARGAAAVVSGR